MDHKEITKRFLEFFTSREHYLLPNESLLPKEHDPSALFVNSGMHVIKEYFLGIGEPPAKQLCNIQSCIRTIDIDDVGDRHHLTYFFMLGSWSLGAYWKKEAINLAWELLTDKEKGLGLHPDRLWATVFGGNSQIPSDDESVDAWIAVGMSPEKIVKLSGLHNFWVSGPTGPCGSCTEVHYDRGKEYGCGKKNCKPGCACDRFLEIWNAGVFIEFNRSEDGNLEPLQFKSVDTGAGLERLSIVLQDVDSAYDTTLFIPIIDKLEELSAMKYNSDKKTTKAMRIIADHLRAAAFIMAEKIMPGKIEQGYILRRLIRRAIRYSRNLNLDKKALLDIIELIIMEYNDNFEYLEDEKEYIIAGFSREYDKFHKTLSKGTKILDKIIADHKKEKKKIISGPDIFKMYDTYGFPFELTKELVEDAGLEVDKEGYEAAFKEHKEKSKGDSEKRFKSGLGDTSEATIKLHTATHLLHTALRQVLGDDVEQKGSNITPERLRFDFTYPEKLTLEQVEQVEKIVNAQIKKGLHIHREEMSPEEAKKKGFLAFFAARYGDKVSTYEIGDFSKEVCTGPHVDNTKELGKFKIIKEQSIAAGVRRIKAILE